MTEIIDKKQSLIVSQSREFVSAVYNLDRNEKRTLYLAILALKNEEYTCDKFNIPQVIIRTRDYATVFGTSHANASRDLAKATKSLSSKNVIFLEPEYDYQELKGMTGINFFVGFSQKPNRGEFVIPLNPQMLPHLLDLESKYVKLQLLDIAKMKNPYSMRLYESLLMHHRNKNNGNVGEVHMKISWMLERYQMPESYKRMSDFRRRFLNVACKEITENTPFKMLDGDRPTYEETDIGKYGVPEKIIFFYLHQP